MKLWNRRQMVGSLASAAFATAAPAVESKSGIVVALVDRRRLVVNCDGSRLTLKLNSSVKFWKGYDGAPLSAIRLGDDLAMRGVMDSDGTFVPSEIWANITAFDGVIRRIAGAIIDVDVVRNDSVPELRRVRIVKKTLSGKDTPFERNHLQMGRQVRVVGLRLKDGTVQASRVNVYVNGRPIGSEGSKVLDMLTGKIVERR